MLYGCIACRLHVCGPNTGQLTHSIVVLDAFMRPEMHFRPTRTPMTAMVGLYAAVCCCMAGMQQAADAAECCMAGIQPCHGGHRCPSGAEMHCWAHKSIKDHYVKCQLTCVRSTYIQYSHTASHHIRYIFIIYSKLYSNTAKNLLYAAVWRART